MRRGGKLEAAPDNGALEHRDDRDRSELHLLEHAVPHHRMRHALDCAALGQFCQIEAGGKIVADCLDQHDFHVLGQVGEKGADAANRRVIQSVALLRSRQPENGNLIAPLDLQ